MGCAVRSSRGEGILFALLSVGETHPCRVCTVAAAWSEYSVSLGLGFCVTTSCQRLVFMFRSTVKKFHLSKGDLNGDSDLGSVWHKNVQGLIIVQGTVSSVSRLGFLAPAEWPTEREKVRKAADHCRRILNCVNQAVREAENKQVRRGGESVTSVSHPGSSPGSVIA